MINISSDKLKKRSRRYHPFVYNTCMLDLCILLYICVYTCILYLMHIGMSIYIYIHIYTYVHLSVCLSMLVLRDVASASRCCIIDVESALCDMPSVRTLLCENSANQKSFKFVFFPNLFSSLGFYTIGFPKSIFPE